MVLTSIVHICHYLLTGEYKDMMQNVKMYKCMFTTKYILFSFQNMKKGLTVHFRTVTKYYCKLLK